MCGRAIGGRAANVVERAAIGHRPSRGELFPRLVIGDGLDLAGRFCPPPQREALKQYMSRCILSWLSG